MTIDIELIEQAFDNNLDGADIKVVEENVNEVFTSLNSGNPSSLQNGKNGLLING